MTRAEAHAAEFDRVNGELVAYLRTLTPEQWLTRGVNSPIIRVGDEDENRPVGTIAHHVAMAHRRTIDNLPVMAAGGQLAPPPPGAAARHAAEHAEPDQAETIALLEERGAQVAAVLRGLTEEQLDRQCTTFLGHTTVGGFIERAVLFHPVWHLSSIRATFEPAGTPGS